MVMVVGKKEVGRRRKPKPHHVWQSGWYLSIEVEALEQ